MTLRHVRIHSFLNDIKDKSMYVEVKHGNNQAARKVFFILRSSHNIYKQTQYYI